MEMPRLQTVEAVPQPVHNEKTEAGLGLPRRLPAKTGKHVIVRRSTPETDAPDEVTKQIDLDQLRRELDASTSNDAPTRPHINLAKLLPRLPPGADPDALADAGETDAAESLRFLPPVPVAPPKPALLGKLELKSIPAIPGKLPKRDAPEATRPPIRTRTRLRVRLRPTPRPTPNPNPNPSPSPSPSPTRLRRAEPDSDRFRRRARLRLQLRLWFRPRLRRRRRLRLRLRARDPRRTPFRRCSRSMPTPPWLPTSSAPATASIPSAPDDKRPLHRSPHRPSRPPPLLARTRTRENRRGRRPKR